MFLVYCLLIYIVPIVLFLVVMYLDMDKGESVRDYLNSYENDTLGPMFIPVLNVGLVALFIIIRIIAWVKPKFLNFKK